LIYPSGNVEALTRTLEHALSDRVRLSELGLAMRKRMETWSPRENIAGAVEAVEQAVARTRHAREVAHSSVDE